MDQLKICSLFMCVTSHFSISWEQGWGGGGWHYCSLSSEGAGSQAHCYWLSGRSALNCPPTSAFYYEPKIIWLTFGIHTNINYCKILNPSTLAIERGKGFWEEKFRWSLIFLSVCNLVQIQIQFWIEWILKSLCEEALTYRTVTFIFEFIT